MEGPQPQGFTSTPEAVRTNVRTSFAESEHADGSDTLATDGADDVGKRFDAALKMLAELPLTHAEKAEAVRRLLADQAAKGKP